MRATRTPIATMGALLLPLVIGASAVAATTEADHRERDRTTTYRIVELGPVAGGTGSAANSITDNGWVAGGTDLSGVVHATLWRNGRATDLGTHGFATSVNDDGLVVGRAETRKRDRTCVGRDQVLQFLGAVWDTERGDQVRALRPLPGDDTTSTGNAINDRGQIVGISGSCDQAVGRFSARAAVLWNPGSRQPIDLGNLGAQAWNTPNSINNHGVVVGFANAEGADPETLFDRPFRWTQRTGMVDLGTLDGDERGQALGINDHDVIVGLSREAPGEPGPPHAVIWKRGQVVDLNELASGYDGHLVYAGDINDDGTITGLAVNADGQNVAFVATRTDD